MSGGEPSGGIARSPAPAGGVRGAAWIAAGLVLAGAGLRAVGLGGWDMWTDEVQTLWMAESGEFWFGPMYRTAPINFWLTGWAVDLLGADEVGLRAVPWLAGVLTLVGLFAVGRRWLSDRAALLATAVLALSFWHVAWSQTGRHFALQTLFVLGALHGFLVYREEGRTWGIAAAGALLLAALFTHSSSGFYVAALLLVVSVAAVREAASAPGVGSALRSLGRRTVVAGLVLLAVLLVYVPIYLGVGAYVLETRSAWNPPWNILGSLGFYVTPLVAAFAAGGAFRLWSDDRELALTLVSLAVLPPVLLTVASGITIASAAYVLPSMVAVALLVGAACDGLLRAAAGRGGLVACASLVVAGLFLVQGRDLVEYYFFQNGLKPRWKDAVEYVREHRQAGEAVWAAEGDVARFYMGREGVHWMGDYPGPQRATAADGTGAWFILYVQSRPDLGAMLAPTLRSADLPEGARFEALFPLSYGAKNRTLVVLHREGGDGGPLVTAGDER